MESDGDVQRRRRRKKKHRKHEEKTEEREEPKDREDVEEQTELKEESKEAEKMWFGLPDNDAYDIQSFSMRGSARFVPETTGTYTLSLVSAGLSRLSVDGELVIDRTRIKGNMDIELNWDVTPEGLKQALIDQLGLELVPGNEFIEFLVVEKALP